MQIGLIILTFIIAAVASLSSRFSSYWTNKLTYLALLLLLVSAGIQIFIELENRRHQLYESETGTIQSNTPASSEPPIIALCASRIGVAAPDGVGFTIGTDPIVTRIVDGTLMVSLVVRDSSGIVRATITDNIWFVPKNSDFILDRNFDDSALELYGASGKPILQIELDGSVVRFAGITYTPSGKGPIGFGPLLTECGEKAPGGTLFKYPSNVFPGLRRVEINRY